MGGKTVLPKVKKGWVLKSVKSRLPEGKEWQEQGRAGRGAQLGSQACQAAGPARPC